MGFKEIYNIEKIYDEKDEKYLNMVLHEAIDDYVTQLKHEYESMPFKVARDCLLSEYNYQVRSQYRSCRKFGFSVYPGDICYIDFGRAYVTEVGYQHFGLVISVNCGKAFVIPMTSNPVQYNMAYDEIENPTGSLHLMRLGKTEGLYKYSVLFLNDGKYINTARIIDVKSKIDPSGEQFIKIRNRLVQGLENNY